MDKRTTTELRELANEIDRLTEEIAKLIAADPAANVNHLVIAKRRAIETAGEVLNAL